MYQRIIGHFIMRITRVLYEDVAKLIQRFSRYQQSSLSIEQFTTFGEYSRFSILYYGVKVVFS